MKNFDECFSTFLYERIEAAEERLRSDDHYQTENATLAENSKKFLAVIPPEHKALYDKIILGKYTTAALRRTNAYKAGFADALKFVASL